jgi:hypothetical protein
MVESPAIGTLIDFVILSEAKDLLFHAAQLRRVANTRNA